MDLELWQVHLDQPPAWVEDRATRWLGSAERERAASGTVAVSRRRLVGAIALRVALARRLGRDPGSVRLDRDANGKPVLARDEGGPVHFSLSRSADRCLVALSSDGPIGVDVERVVAVPEFERIAARRFARDEVAAIMVLTGDRRLRAFYDCWTRKEAYVKASGIGLAAGLERVEVSVAPSPPRIVSLAGDDATRWTLVDVDLGEGFAGAAVIGNPLPYAQRSVSPATLPLPRAA